MIHLLLLLPLLAAAMLPVSANAAPSLVDLRTEYLDNPLGLDVAAPRFSWQLQEQGEERGISQQSYRVVVKSKSSNVIVWDSKFVSSNKSWNVVYEGEPLVSGSVYEYTISVTALHVGGGSRATLVSAAALFSVGLLKPGDWKPSSWIGAEKNDTQAPW